MFQEGVKVAVNGFEAVPDGPDAPLWKVRLRGGALLGGVLLRRVLGAVPQAQGQAQNRCLEKQPHPAAGSRPRSLCAGREEWGELCRVGGRRLSPAAVALLKRQSPARCPRPVLQVWDKEQGPQPSLGFSER